MAFEPRNITKEHVLKGLEKIKKNQIVLEPSTRWLVEINNKTYPPKEIMRYAHEQMNGEKLWNYSGGDGTNNFLAKMGFEIIDKSISNESLFFHDIIEEVKQLLQSNDQTRDLFTFSKANKNYVWIGDNQNVIGNEIAHYEISLNKIKDKFTVDVHFEGSNKDKDEFIPLTQNLPIHLKSFKWHNGRSIRYEDVIDKNNPDLINEITNQLIYIENTIGNEIREIIKRIKTTITQPSKNMSSPLNQILYGPPGTGKTYNTINKALEIIGEKTEGKSRAEIKGLFDQRMKDGQIIFTTFHQSMCYEDFIEGIKPIALEEEKGQVIYKIIDGIFKQLSVKAKYQFYKNKNQVFKKISREEYFNIAYEETIDIFKQMLSVDKNIPLSTKSGVQIQVVEISERDNITVQHANSKISKEYTVSKERLSKLFFHFTDLDNIKNIDKEFRAVIGGSNATAYWAVLNALNNAYEKVVQKGSEFDQIELFDYDEIKKAIEFFTISKDDLDSKNIMPYVLIIDEINRGNVSQIFGELITLIEDDKRLGQKEALEVTLPYSKERFGVPPNLHIIGTMNTADRSVEALDAALRRRFSFQEMPPKPELISPQRKIWELWWEHPTLGWEEEPYLSKELQLYNFLGITQDIDPNAIIWERMKIEGKNENQISNFDNIPITGFNLETLLRTINKRIELLLDKDHQIGHSYFMSVSSPEELKIAFQNKIIPLLQEYFFGDYGKIGLVLGKGFFESEEKNTNSKVFADFDYPEIDYSDKPLYTLKNLTGISDEEFKAAINSLLNN